MLQLHISIQEFYNKPASLLLRPTSSYVPQGLFSVHTEM